MAYSRASVPELENLLKYGKKKFVRYEEGAKLYSMGLHSFQELAGQGGKCGLMQCGSNSPRLCRVPVVRAKRVGPDTPSALADRIPLRYPRALPRGDGFIK